MLARVRTFGWMGDGLESRDLGRGGGEEGGGREWMYWLSKKYTFPLGFILPTFSPDRIKHNYHGF